VVSEAQQERGGLPVRRVTVNELVAYNMAFYRRAAGMTQEQLGERIGGWSTASVSAAERSWDGRRVRKYDADELFAIASALRVPIPALLLPPEDHRTVVNYEIAMPGGDVPAVILIVFAAGEEPPAEDQSASPVLRAYRHRLIAAGFTGAKSGQDSAPTANAPAGSGATAEPHAKETEEGRTAGYRAAEVIVQQAKMRAQYLELDAQERHRQAMGTLVRQRDQLERQIDDLRAYEREYRTRLQLYLETQVRNLYAENLGPTAERIVEALREEGATRGAVNPHVLVLNGDGTYKEFAVAPDADDADAEPGNQS
jgi:transcriptional regulator with XRE-family HTH domain